MVKVPLLRNRAKRLFEGRPDFWPDDPFIDEAVETLVCTYGRLCPYVQVIGDVQRQLVLQQVH